VLSKITWLGKACFYPFVLALVRAKALNNSPWFDVQKVLKWQANL